jgi:glycosyltransferase involved in cell wall biosynthesis
MVLITYNQANTVEAALRAALAQTYQPLEIVVSDDASTDDTFARITAVAQRYSGPHTLLVHRNATNQGIGANLSQAVLRSSGELIVIAAGDDISVPTRCEVLAKAWVASEQRLDLLASSLVDMDEAGGLHGTLQPSPLQALKTPDDWLAHRPYVVGAAQAWTRRLFDRFGPLPTGVVAEDLVMVFRAIAEGGALTVPEVLVQYRRGGLSRSRRRAHPQVVIDGWLRSNRHALIEAKLMLQDSDQVGCSAAVRAFLSKELAKAEFMAGLFQPASRLARLRFGLTASGMPWGKRLRLLVYAVCPELLMPFFWLKSALG